MDQEYLENDVQDEQIVGLPSEEEMEAAENLLLNSSDESDETSIEPFKIDENMPDELKQQLEKFNNKVNNLNIIRNEDVSADISIDNEEESDDDNEEVVENGEIDEENISLDDIGDLF